MSCCRQFSFYKDIVLFDPSECVVEYTIVSVFLYCDAKQEQHCKALVGVVIVCKMSLV